MPSTNVDIILRARDEASAKLRALSGEMGGLVGTVQRLSVGMGTVGVAVTAIATATVAAIALVKRTSDEVELLDRAAAKTGVGIEPMQAMFAIVRDGGGDVEVLTKALVNLNKQVSQGNPLLKQMGIVSRDPLVVFQQVAKVLAAVEDQALATDLATDLFGKSGADLLPTMKDLATRTSDVESELRKTKALVSEEMAPAFREFDTQMEEFGRNWKGVMTSAAAASASFATAVVANINNVFTMLRGMKNQASSFTPFLGAGAAAGALAVSSQSAEAKERERIIQGLAESRNRSQQAPAGPTGDFLNDIHERIRQSARDEVAEIKPITLDDRKKQLGISGLAEEIRRELTAAEEDFIKFSDTVRNAFDEIGQHVYSGFYSVLTNLTNKTQTFGSAMKTIWQSIVSGILSAMAQIVSSAITAAFLKLLGMALSAVTGNPVFAMAGNAAAGRFMGSGSDVVTVAGPGGAGMPETSSLSPAGMGASSAGMARGGDNYYIQTFSAKDLLTSLVSPRGELRTANSRLIEIASAS